MKRNYVNNNSSLKHFHKNKITKKRKIVLILYIITYTSIEYEPYTSFEVPKIFC